MWKLTDSEWKVLEALWAGGPQHLGQILGALAPETGWSRTTVHTYLTRMAAKGLVSMDQSSPRRYAAIPSRETCAARERRDLVDRVYDGSAGQLVAAFVKDGSLSPRSGRSCAACWTRWRCSRVRSLVLPPSDGGGQHGRPFVLVLQHIFRDKLSPSGSTRSGWLWCSG